MKTYRATEKDFKRKTYLIDANGKTLGRLATGIAALLMGKGKTCYSHDQLCGDQVVVLNASKVHVTGKKRTDKIYDHYTGFDGGLKTYPFEDLIKKHPDAVISEAVKRMLPKNRLRSEMLRRLRVFAGDKHTHQAQQPVPFEIKT
ncbi:MAG: 50S ribosomal protein L13 [Omnitrophica bacterium GWA2_52_12]|nr:MAG: 50S ribosomal protein L13 [Omnitrophica bacterium GWA2_52_12]